MALYDRLIGYDDGGVPVAGKIGLHAFNSVLHERARGVLATDAAARDCMNSMINPALDAAEEQEALTLLGTITGALVAKLQRALEINDVLILGEQQALGYATPTAIKARLGV